jgi:hypothetical protein
MMELPRWASLRCAAWAFAGRVSPPRDHGGDIGHSEPFDEVAKELFGDVHATVPQQALGVIGA